MIPPAVVLERFETITTPLLARCQENDRESKRLAEFRDRLLRRLLSGEIRLQEAEKVVVGR